MDVSPRLLGRPRRLSSFSPRRRRALLAESREALQRCGRASDALAHLAQWSQSPAVGSPGLPRAYFEATLGCGFGHPEARGRAEALILAAPSRLNLSNYALGLAQCARDHGIPLGVCAPARAAVWESHNGAFHNMPAASMPQDFAARHLGLALNFPDEAGELLSLSLATAPMLAQIERAQLGLLMELPGHDRPGPGGARQAPPTRARWL